MKNRLVLTFNTLQLSNDEMKRSVIAHYLEEAAKLRRLAASVKYCIALYPNGTTGFLELKSEYLADAKEYLHLAFRERMSF
jgi:hypothetical protein